MVEITQEVTEKEIKIEDNKNKKIFKYAIISVIILLIIAGVYYLQINKTTGNMINENNKGTLVKLETNYGDIVIELMPEQKITAGNFENLVRKGVYNGVIFHRVIEGFMIQGGDPTGTGYGDPKIPSINDEFNGKQENNRGTIAMANAGPNTGSSQFFINLVNNNFLDGRHPVFGKVIEGMNIVDAIGKVETDASDKPLKRVIINKASII
jgi:peptidylprolyl isomerase